MKKLLKLDNIFLLLLLGFFLYSKGPIIVSNFKTEGKLLPPSRVQVLSTNAEIDFPPKGKSIAIYWSTTCAPCKLEMARLKTSVENGKIPSASIYAINTFETENQIKKFLKKNKYPFTFISNPDLPLDIRATPTSLFIEDGKVLKLSSGMSLTGIWSAEGFLEN